MNQQINERNCVQYLFIKAQFDFNNFLEEFNQQFIGRICLVKQQQLIKILRERKTGSSQNQLKMLILTLLAIIFTSVISQELIVDNLQNQYVATGQSYHKDWSKIEWNNNLDFAIYGWFKISSQYVLDNWVVGFQFSSNDNSRLTDKSNLGDRVLSLFIWGNIIVTPTYSTQSNQPNIYNYLYYNSNDLDKWIFIYVAYGSAVQTQYTYIQLPSSGVLRDKIPNIIHYTSNFYQIQVGFTKYYTHYFAGQICSLYILAGSNAYTDNDIQIIQLSNLQPQIALSCSFCKYMNLQLQFQFIVQFCNQNGAKTAQEPLDIQLISNGVPNLSQTFSQFSKSILQINLKKYQIPLDQNLDIQINSSQTNITCLQKQQYQWSSQNCQLVKFNEVGENYCYCKSQTPTTITNDLKQLIQNKNLQTAFSQQGIENVSNFRYFYKYVIFWLLSSITLIQIGLFKYGQSLDKKQNMYQIVPEQIIQPSNNKNNNQQALGLQDLAENKEQDNNNQKEFNLSRQQDEIKQFPNKGILKQRQESHFSQSQFTNPNIIQKDLPSQEQQNEKQYEKSPEQDIQIIELDQLEQKQDNQNQQLAKESKKHKKQILIIKQNEENQQFDSLNNQESQNSLQKKLQNQMLTLTNVYSNINTNQNIFSTSLIPQQQQNPSLNQFQINKANTNQQSSIMNLEQQQTSLVNNLDKLNYLDKQKEELQIEKLDQQSNNGISIEQDQNTNRKNSNNQQEQSIEQSKLAEEEQKLTEQYIIDKNLQKLFQKPLAIRIILYHDFFNIFYIYDNKMSRGIRLNIFYLRIIHSLCLTTIFDDSYNIFQKIVISILSSIILVTGVKIITLIHKIKRVGQKLSLVILLSLLVFYYYVILSIISGEEPSYANSKTVSFVLILGIDFLGTLTLVSILKLSLIYLSKKYLKNENKIFIKLYNLLDLKLQILNLAF
ncbi:hypothetical protein ABPG74_006733 [Tetrahymena malaccensis]